ncbi:PucR family transcriptional regulator [Amycolatopsis jejuensis]|uniref:PucR family transcriptional regulator n=1 Tax=Amycolatopsis jejuensis TaxID=330084 RepID=UPI0005251339|nr:PucR family transcriptional regulator [Amycolatopsis jejuensis]
MTAPCLSSPAPATLAALAEAAELEILAAPAGAHAPVHAVRIGDLAPGALVLAVGLDPTSNQFTRLLTEAAETGAAGVVTRRPADATWVQARARHLGIAVLALPTALTWDEALTRTRAALGSGAPEPGIGDPRSALADAAAVALGGAVDITDHHLRLVAYSALDHESDDLRRATVVARRVPDDLEQRLRTSGELNRITHAHAPVLLDEPPRLVTPLRAGPEVLGYLWLSPVGATFGPGAQAGMTDVARAVAATLVRTATPGRDRRAAEALREALSGSSTPGILLGGREDDAFQLVGFRLRDRAALSEVDGAHLEHLVALRLSPLAVTRWGDGVYAMVTPSIDTGLITDLVARSASQLGMKLVAVLGQPSHGRSAVSQAGRELERALRVEAHQDVVSIMDLRTQCILHEPGELAAERPHLMPGYLRRLAETDEPRLDVHRQTLQAYFDANCDMAAAARALYVHRNTMRYRLRRLQELSGMDLESPLDRLLAELELRLSTPDGGAS